MIHKVIIRFVSKLISVTFEHGTRQSKDQKRIGEIPSGSTVLADSKVPPTFYYEPYGDLPFEAEIFERRK
jgi:hypothetical protein